MIDEQEIGKTKIPIWATKILRKIYGGKRTKNRGENTFLQKHSELYNEPTVKKVHEVKPITVTETE